MYFVMSTVTIIGCVAMGWAMGKEYGLWATPLAGFLGYCAMTGALSLVH